MSSVLAAVVSKKPYLKRLTDLLALDKPLGSERELASVVHAGIAPEVVDRLVREGLSARDVAFVTPPRTLSHRKARGERLTLEETDRAVRAARIVALADSIFANHEKALAWLHSPRKVFEGRRALDALATEIGARLVEEELTRIDEGYFA
jgi:putative toxin-antitoxin system antitoxin component (TIGR02293 family)